jgi:hypothetical protein
MPPKRGSAKRPPHVNVPQVLDQPLSALGSAISALRGRPYAMVLSEAQGVARESAALLVKMADGITGGHGLDLVPPGVALLLDCAVFSPECEALIVRAIATSVKAMQALDSIVKFGVEDRRIDVEAQIDLLEVVELLADSEIGKEDCGRRFMARVARLLAAHQPHFALHRALCGVIIALVKGSKSNKLRLPRYSAVCKALVTTTDYFLQLQCVEVLYRVARQHSKLLDDVRDELPPMLYDGIRTVPNTSDLFKHISQLVDSWNATRDPQLIVGFDVERVEAGRTMLTGATRVYFSPKTLIVILATTSVDNVSIEFTTIRSVRLRADVGLVIRLREPPAVIADRMSMDGDAGQDTLLLQFNSETMIKFRQSNINKWINAALKESRDVLRAWPEDADSPAGRLSHNRRVAGVTSKMLVAAQHDLAPQGEAAPVPTAQHHHTPGGEGDQAGGSVAAPLSASNAAAAAASYLAQPKRADYYPTPYGLNIARNLDMNTPMHPDPFMSTSGAHRNSASLTLHEPVSAEKQERSSGRRPRETDAALATELGGLEVAASSSLRKKHFSENAFPEPVHDSDQAYEADAGQDGATPPLDRSISVGGGGENSVSAESTGPRRPVPQQQTTAALINPLAASPPSRPRTVGSVRQPSTSALSGRTSVGRSAPKPSVPTVSPQRTEGGNDDGIAAIHRILGGRGAAQQAQPTAAPRAADGQSVEKLFETVTEQYRMRRRQQENEALAATRQLEGRVQTLVDEGCEDISRSIATFKSFVSDHIARMRDGFTATSDALDAAVRDVNSSMLSGQETRRRVGVTVSSIEHDFGSASGRLVGREDEELKFVRQHVDAELVRLEQTAGDLFAKRPPAMTLGSHLVERTSNSSTGAGMQAKPPIPPRSQPGLRLGSLLL